MRQSIFVQLLRTWVVRTPVVACDLVANQGVVLWPILDAPALCLVAARDSAAVVFDKHITATPSKVGQRFVRRVTAAYRGGIPVRNVRKMPPMLTIRRHTAIV